MLTHFCKTMAPNLNDISIEMSVKLNKKIVVRYQHDDAPPQTEAKFLHFIQIHTFSEGLVHYKSTSQYTSCQCDGCLPIPNTLEAKTTTQDFEY